MSHQPPCWNADEVIRLVKPDAEEIDDHVFTAIHSPIHLQLAETADSPTFAASAEEFVARFLDPNRKYVQAVVLGDSGTGKSHLIQWLRMHIPDEPGRTVKLTIPKTGTSLRGIVERLIAELPESERAPFSERLRETGTRLINQDAKIDLFLNALAWSIEHGGKTTDDIDDGLKQLLPSVFLDPYLRRDYFRVAGGSVDQLVKHIFEPPEERGPESVREFTERDLPIDGRLYSKTAEPTKDAIDFINSEAGILPRAIAMMNVCLEGAISHALNFSADNLIDLMSALRRHLETQGKRLILLIEDFARLQGIDSALLQALITPPVQGNDRLCEIRWAMAVTTGYFRRLDSTVRSRANIVVDMDNSAPASIEAMTAGYLNAVRVGEKKLLNLGKSTKVPNACQPCGLRESCFSAFGEVNEIGLFPFTRKAIEIMADRTRAMDENKFNPRRYLRAVVEPVLFGHFSEIERGEFPSTLILGRFGGTRNLSSANRTVLTRKDGDELAERRIALLELWEGSGRLVNLSNGVQEAFGIPTLKDAELVTTPSPAEPTRPSGDTPPQEEIVPHIGELRAWEGDRRVLPQGTVNELRRLVYAALESYIDWDALGLKKSEIASASGGGSIPFRRLSINFHDQQVQSSQSIVTLTLPLNPKSIGDRRDTALALQALVLFSRNKSWDFHDAGIVLPSLLETLERWADHVKRQIQKCFASTKTWNPTTAAAELLALGIHQSGRVPIEANVSSLILRVWESGEPPAMACLNPQFEQVNRTITQQWVRLQKILRVFCSGTKGGVAGNFVAPIAVTQAVRGLRQRSLRLSQEPPVESEVGDLRQLADVYRDVKARYFEAFQSERDAWQGWYKNLDEAVGTDTLLVKFIESLRTTMADFEGAGLLGGHALPQLKQSIEAINANAADRAREALRRVDSSNTTEALLRIAAMSRLRESIDDLIAGSNAFLSHAEVSLKNRFLEGKQKAGPGLQQSRETISSSLIDMVSATSVFISGPGRAE